MNDIVAEYEQFVMGCVQKFGSLSNLIREDEIDPNELNLALGSFLRVNAGLLAEYQKAKMKFFYAQEDFEDWYAEKFEECKIEVISEYDTKNADETLKKNMIKPSLKEYSNRVRAKHKKEYRMWIESKTTAEYEMRFILRLLDLLKKYDNILTTLSNNMRQEMRTLSVQNRMNADPENVSNNKVRTEFPSKGNRTRRALDS